MNRQGWIRILIWIVLLLVLVVLYVRSTAVDVREHLAMTADIEELRQLDERLGQLVLKKRTGLLLNYDTLVLTEQAISARLQRIAARRPDLFAAQNTPLAAAFSRYRAIHADKVRLLERFKSQHAVLYNSLRYFPYATQALLASLPQGTALERRLRQELLVDMLIYQSVPTAFLRQKLEDELAALEGVATGPSVARAGEMQSVLRHARLLLQYKDATDDSIVRIFAHPSIATLDEVSRLYGEEYQATERQAETYRFWLMLFALGGLLYGGYSLLRIQRAQRELAASLRELEFQKYALDQHSIVSIADRSGKIIYTNEKFSEISKYTREELLGQDHRILNSGYHSKAFFKEMWTTIGHGKVWQGEVCNRAKDGSLYWVASTIVPFMDANGKPERYVSIRTDITARKRLDAEIKAQRDFYELITETLGEGLYVQDAEGKCIYMNGEAERLLGWRREEFIGMPVHDTIHRFRADGSPLPREECPLMLLTRSGEVMMSEDQVFLRKSGERFPVAAVSQGYFKDGIYQGAVVAFQDISARKEAEIALREAKEAAEAASRAKSDFLANMSHEIRTPMNGIIGMTELALDTPLSNEQREYLTLVKTSADALLAIVNDILDFSKIEAGKMGIEEIEFNLPTLLSQTMRSIAVRAHEKGLELLLDIDPDIPQQLIGDPGRIRQILVNLVGNAIKFTERGEVMVRVRRAAIQPVAGRLQLRIEVQDTGIGIPREKFATIFESFSQADGSTTRKYGGTGLGLTISARLVELMGGKIWVESTVGQGSTFFFEISLGETVPEDQPVYPASSLKGLRVLVADDNETNRKLACELLLRWQMEPVGVAGGDEALATIEAAQAAGAPFQLLLLDGRMPDRDGFSIVEKLRESRKCTATPIMMLTSDGQKGDAARCRELGIAAYLLKPYSQSDLFDAIMITMGQRAQSSLITRHSLKENRRQLHVLLAEDNAVNQTLATRLLAKFGHSVTVAGNGREALEKWQAGNFDLILMDVDMPEMNGFDATREIRQREGEGQHIPIIGLTAHVIQGTREECLAAGMDGYLAKPIDTEALWRELEGLSGTTVSVRTHTPHRFDKEAALALMDHDPQLFDTMVDIFLADYPAHLKALRAAQAAGERATIKHEAHTLKGMLAVFAVPALVEEAEAMERDPAAVHEESVQQFAAGLAWLEEEIRRAKLS